ncbi:hypothetical protein [Lentilitoribacter sp. Alg239-R112]|uniref:hypothetical protein n=1 Tax=Lentilitoribacter sp. Alg239-R112 TaxID=2305987 RepID=UPI0013A6D247|nr:hypothetical protein [Lentilitoribacter sp. Alg239-R112]
MSKESPSITQKLNALDAATDRIERELTELRSTIYEDYEVNDLERQLEVLKSIKTYFYFRRGKEDAKKTRREKA